MQPLYFPNAGFTDPPVREFLQPLRVEVGRRGDRLQGKRASSGEKRLGTGEKIGGHSATVTKYRRKVQAITGAAAVPSGVMERGSTGRKRAGPSDARKALASAALALYEKAARENLPRDARDKRRNLIKDAAPKTLYNLAHDLDNDPRLSTIDKVANAFGLQAWQLLVPGTADALRLGEQIGRIVTDYLRSEPEGRDLLERTAAQLSRRTGSTG